ncbi:MAG: PDZ domain-containing protein [Thermococci archaeon]|nr:PDZ domain-containing protein [Thermococci archaeon]
MNTTLLVIIAGILGFWMIMFTLFGREEVDPETGQPVEKEEGLEVGMFMLMWRTKRFLNFIEGLARKSPRLWRVYADVGIIFGFAGMVYVFYALARTAVIALRTGGKAAGVQLVVPGLTIPLWYGLVGLAVVLIVHELSHGVVARSNGIPLKSVGLALLVVLPGAFVEPDEEELKKASLRKRLRVYGAGSLANMITGLIAVIIIGVAILPLFQPAGITVASVLPNTPASGNLHAGDVITAINGHPVPTLKDFMDFMNTTKPGQVITLDIVRKGTHEKVRLKLANDPYKKGKGFIGIKVAQHFRSKVGHKDIVLPLYFSLYWIYVLNIGIGLMNLFPLVPLDGGRMLDDVLKRFLPRRVVNPVRYTIIGIGLLLFALNFWPALMNLAR